MRENEMLTPCCGTQGTLSTAKTIEKRWELGDSGKKASYFRCSTCGSLFMQPFPSAEEMISHFSVADYRDSSLEQLFIGRKAPRYLYVFQTLQRLQATPGQLIDVGCAHGYGLGIANEFKWQATGIEMDDSIAMFARGKGYRVQKGTSISDAKLGQNPDAVLYIDVLFYFTNPAHEIRMAYDKLNAGGWIVARVSLWGPFVSTLVKASRVLWSKFLLKKGANLLCDHLVIFSEKGFDLSLRNAGFQICHKSVDWGYGWRASQSLPARVVRKLTESISGISGVRCTPSMFIIARKPV